MVKSDFSVPRHFEKYRIRPPGRGPGDDQNGVFNIPEMGVRVEISQGHSWQRCIIMRSGRSVAYADIEYFRLAFWTPNVTVTQRYSGPEKDGHTVTLYRAL